MTTPSYPQLRDLISRLEGKDKAIASKALYGLDRLGEKVKEHEEKERDYLKMLLLQAGTIKAQWKLMGRSDNDTND